MSSNNEFDVYKFNQEFENSQNKIEEEEIINIEEIEDDKLHEMSIGEIFINMKEEVFGIINDVLSLNYESSFSEIFTKNNRLFYFGLFLLIICAFLYIISYLFYYPKPKDRNLNINANLGIPNDYKFNYYPYKKQDVNEIRDNRNTINSLRNELNISNSKIKYLQRELSKRSVVDTGNLNFEVDGNFVDPRIVPKDIKDNAIKSNLINSDSIPEEVKNEIIKKAIISNEN